MKKFILVVNDGVVEVDGKNVFDESGIKELIVKRGGGKDSDFGLNNSVEDISLEELWKVLLGGGKIEVIDEELCEMGDDYVELEVFEIKM